MKLVKSICVQCHNKNRIRKWDRQPAKERSWVARGKIACVVLLDIHQVPKYISIDKPPPYECYYRVEQLLSGE